MHFIRVTIPHALEIADREGISVAELCQVARGKLRRRLSTGAILSYVPDYNRPYFLVEGQYAEIKDYFTEERCEDCNSDLFVEHRDDTGDTVCWCTNCGHGTYR